MSEMTGLEKDLTSRERIVREIDRNFFVEAGAGSGKTTMLVGRMVAMVEAGIPIGKICAITFTKAAAGEFYDRFQKSLIERSNPDYVWEDKGHAGQLPPPTELSRARCSEALKNIDLCFMGTIDSFGQMILSEHPSEARIPSDVTITSDQEVKTFFRQMYVKILSGEYGKELSDLAGLFSGMHRNAEEVFAAGEAVMMDVRNAHFNYPPIVAADLDKVLFAEQERLTRLTGFLKEHKELRYDDTKDSVAAWERIDRIHKELQRPWRSNLDGVLYNLNALSSLRLIPEADGLYERELGEFFVLAGTRKKWLECTPLVKAGIPLKLKELQYSVSMTFLCACVPILERAMREKGAMTYFDALYYLREMLRRDAEKGGKLIRHIYERHSFYLIDEFQDTNPMQAEVFFYLTAEHPVPCWSDCDPRPGSLFIVGDPKQSIYRFRSADVASFLKVKALFEKHGGTILALPRNFRSTKVLCEHFNQTFTRLLPEETADQSRFEEIPVPEETTDEFQGIYAYRACKGKLAAKYPEETDPAQIAGIIETLVGREEFRIRTKKGETLRPIRFSDIMVITPKKENLIPLMAKLQERGIPTKVEGQVPFGRNQALNAVFQIYRALADQNDAVALYGALTGILFGLAREEIMQYRKEGGRLSLRYSPDPEAYREPAARRTAEKILELKRYAGRAARLSPAALFSMIMDDLQIYRIAEAEELEVVCYTLELLRNAEGKGAVVSLRDGAAYLSELIGGVSGEERCLSLQDDRDAVHMANLHKVKGLEAPVIILSSALKFSPFINLRIEHLEDGTEGYLFSLPKKNREGITRGSYFETKAFPDEEQAETDSTLAEKARLIYVGATRARNALLICDSIQPGAGGSEKVTSAWAPIRTPELPDFFETFPKSAPAPKGTIETVTAEELYREAGENGALKDRSCENASYTVENPSRFRLSSKMAEEQAVYAVMEPVSARAEEEQAPERVDPMFPALLGTMVHKLMEMLVSTRNQVDAEEAVSEILREYLTMNLKPFEADLRKVLLSAAERIRNGGYPQPGKAPKDILQVLLTAEEVFCEVPFCYLEDGEEGGILWNGIMDVVYRSEGKWHIVDYKTNADGSDLDRKYAGQLQAYIRAFRETTGEEADAVTYHIDL